ncbi:hypothetical protein L2E82_35558 [Cichorium intybus]|uniref:Uncharacterized protein n=1 Tax=Cichorium intybus TaxID=13427 RepID=A0ACB9BP62_CICIN|nr:hypothetical protein L2E82_35558 [Cichorium intybus]
MDSLLVSASSPIDNQNQQIFQSTTSRYPIRDLKTIAISAQQQALGSTGTVLETNKEDEEEYQFQDEEIELSEEQDVRNLNDSHNDIVEQVAEIEEEQQKLNDSCQHCR